MIKRSEYTRVQQQAAAMIRAAGIQLTEAEAQRIDVVDFGLGRVAAEGVQVFTFFATERISAKVLVMLPHQTEPEHWHPPVGDDPGKEETFRVRAGSVVLWVDGHGELDLGVGDQFTIEPDTLHWFRAGDEGAIVSEFSTRSRDETDVFTDPRIRR